MPLRTAEIIAVGSEMLGSTRIDTNSLYVTERLTSIGIDVRVKSVVGDDRDALAAVFRQALTRADLVVLTGGLGPTDDDLTREAVADVLGLPFETDEAIVDRIRARFAKRGMEMPEINRRQAQVPRGAAVLDNPNGTAPGLLIDRGHQVVLLLPGPPRELKPMLDRVCDGALRDRGDGARAYQVSLFVTGRGESHVDQIVQPAYARWRDETPPISTTILATMGQIELHLTLRDTDAARAKARLARARDELHTLLGDDVYSVDGRAMEEVIGALLSDRGYTIAAAESCTGGLLTSRLTDVPGSSAYVRASVVAYANEEKTAFLDVPAEMIAAHGAVSEPVAAAMAEGIRLRTGADVGIGITGIAGPGGGTPDKPVGTVAIAVIVPDRPAYVRTYQFMGGRAMIKFQSTQAAMDRVRRLLAVRSS